MCGSGHCYCKRRRACLGNSRLPCKRCELCLVSACQAGTSACKVMHRHIQNEAPLTPWAMSV